MIVLALDAALAACQAAVTDGGRVLARRSEPMERGHQERLAPMVAEVLAEAGLPSDAIERIAVTVGPGSFTGLRVGLAFAKGMALGLGVPCAGIGTLEALAASTGSMGRVLAVIEGPRGQAYLQGFEAGAPVGEPAVYEGEAALAFAAAFGAERVTGPGAARFALAAVADPRPWPDLEAVARLAAAREAPLERPAPLYLRAPDARTMAERRALAAAP